MDDGRIKKPTGLEQIAQSIAIAVGAISAGLKLYREIQALRRDSTEFKAVQAKLRNLESELAKEHETQQFHTGSREQVTAQLADIRRRIKDQLGRMDDAKTLDDKLEDAQTALQKCGGEFSGPYPDAGTSSHRSPAGCPPYPSSRGRYHQHDDSGPYGQPSDGGYHSPAENIPRDSSYPGGPPHPAITTAMAATHAGISKGRATGPVNSPVTDSCLLPTL
ncbi:hypothetical protein JB92DRAFT_761603 [Gautieria morchelliformis]|nr:hypothetical protein JB92DRAFT_761603 [Gautieria morchelliformis]